MRGLCVTLKYVLNFELRATTLLRMNIDCYTDTQPTLPELVKLKIPQMIGQDYETFGTVLLNDERGKMIDAIVEANSARAKEINMAILKKWLRGEGKQPVTWGTLVQVLKDSDLKSVAKEIEAAISSPLL